MSPAFLSLHGVPRWTDELLSVDQRSSASGGLRTEAEVRYRQIWSFNPWLAATAWPQFQPFRVPRTRGGIRELAGSHQASDLGSVSECPLLAEARLKPPSPQSSPRTCLPRRRPGMRGQAFLLLRPNGKQPSPVSSTGRRGVKEVRHFLHPRQTLNCAPLFPIAGRVVAGPPGSNKPPHPCPSAWRRAAYFVEKDKEIACLQSGRGVRFVRFDVRIR
jgi:hypothetical protein